MRHLAATSLFALLAACSSSSDDAPSVGTTLLAPTIEIDDQNAQVALQSGVRSVFDIIDIGLIGARFIRVPKPETPVSNASPLLAPLLLTRTVTGPQGGNAVFTWDDADQNSVYSTGDIFTMTLNNYGAEDLIFNGSMVLDNVRLLGNPDSVGWVFDADLNLQGVNIEWQTDAFDVTATIPVHLEDRIVTEYFRCFLPDNVFLGRWEILAGSAFDYAVGPDRYSLNFSGAVFSTELDGIVSFYTEAPLEGLDLSFLKGPSFGEFFVAGANGTILRNELALQNFRMVINPRIVEGPTGNEVEENDGQVTVTWPSLYP